MPCGPIYRMNEVFADPQVKHLNITRHVPHKVLGEVEVIGQAVELSPHAVERAQRHAGARRAHRRRCCANWATARRRSPGCASARSCSDRGHSHRQRGS